MVRRIQNFSERCEVYKNEMIKVNVGDEENEVSDLSPEFINLMVVILPYIKEQNGKFTIRELMELTGSDVQTFYQILSTNLYKNPRSLTLVMRLIQVQDALRSSNKSIEEIAEECHFESPNGMIASFYHQFRMTPRDYRLSI